MGVAEPLRGSRQPPLRREWAGLCQLVRGLPSSSVQASTCWTSTATHGTVPWRCSRPTSSGGARARTSSRSRRSPLGPASWGMLAAEFAA
eukprot:5665529-Pyramimonas_sp.AAC.1